MKKIIGIVIIGLLIVNTIFISSAIGNEELIDKKMVKVYIENQDDMDTLSNLGLEIYVIEQNYLAIRITNEEEQELERIGFSVTPIKEDELVHRIVKVVIKNQEDINELANLGLDIWEVNQGYFIAMVYDKHIIEIKEKGFVVEILYESEKDFQKSGFDPVQAISQAGVSYHSYSSLKTDLQNLENNYPNIAKVYDIGDSWEKTQGIADRDILAIKISDNVVNEEDDEPDILFMGGTHAREWISVEVPFYLAKYLIEHYSTDQKVKQLVDSKEIWIVPLVNPDGFEYSRTDNRLWRKNRRDNGDGTFGVDPNRNFGYKWGQQGSSGDPASNTYRGTAPFSEPETQAIRNLESTHDFSSSISYHSYSQLVLYPWGYTKDAPPHKVQLSKMVEDMATEIKKVHGKTYTPEQASDLYIVSGDSDDWLYGVHNIAAFTIELRPKNPWDNWFKPFELPEDQIIPTWEENKPAALYLIEWFQELDIKSPTEASPASAGAFDNPGHIEITVEVKDIKGPMTGYSATDFSFKIGGKEAIASLIDTSIPGKYVFDVTPPTQVAAGKYDLEVEVICAGCSSKDIEQDAVEYTSGNVDVMLIIDRSGSMWGSKIADAKDSAKLFINYMRDNDKAGVVSFSTYAGYNYHLTTLTPSVKTAIKTAINGIYASGWTAMGRGLRYGLNDLTSRGDSTHPWAMVLLSDGYHNTGEHPNNVLPAIRNANIKVFTIGLGPYVDANLLRSIAANSGAGGGKYYYAPSSSDLKEIYDLIVGMVTGQQTSYSTTGTILPGQTSSLTVPITSSTTSATFSISWGGSDLDLVLYKPDSTEINPGVAAADPNIDYVEESTYEFYRVANPDAGEWTMEITAISVPTGGEDYTAKVRVASTLTISLSTDKDQYNQGETVKTTVSLTEGGSPLTGATVSADITLPGGSTETLTLYDDGGHGDTAANDGVYANYFANTLQTGDYTVDVSATGTTPTGEQFSREDQCTFKVVAGPSLITLEPDTWIDTANTGEQIQSTFTVNDPAKIGELFPLDESTYAEYNGTHYLVYNESSIGGEPDYVIPAPPSSESLAEVSTVDSAKIVSPSVSTKQLSSSPVSKWVSLTATSLQTPTGDVIAASNVIISPNVLEVPLGGSEDFDVTINIPSDAVGGTYTGKIVASAITGSDSIDITLTVEEAVDTTPPTIESVTLDAYTTVLDATIHVTVEATDNVGVTSVTADSVALVETGNIWEGDITAPSTTGGYSLTIRAEDAAGNFAETTEGYSVVTPQGGMGIAVLPRLSPVTAGSTVDLDVKIVSNENFDDVFHVYLTTDGLPPIYQADLSWFNWTDTTVAIPAGGEAVIPLRADIPGGASGIKAFRAKVESTKWTPKAMDTGIFSIS